MAKNYLADNSFPKILSTILMVLVLLVLAYAISKLAEFLIERINNKTILLETNDQMSKSKSFSFKSSIRYLIGLAKDFIDGKNDDEDNQDLKRLSVLRIRNSESNIHSIDSQKPQSSENVLNELNELKAKSEVFLVNEFQSSSSPSFSNNSKNSKRDIKQKRKDFAQSRFRFKSETISEHNDEINENKKLNPELNKKAVVIDRSIVPEDPLWSSSVNSLVSMHSNSLLNKNLTKVSTNQTESIMNKIEPNLYDKYKDRAPTKIDFKVSKKNITAKNATVKNV